MRLSHRMEQFLASMPRTTVRMLARRFGVSEIRCREELEQIMPFGVELTDDGLVFASADAPPQAARRRYRIN